jgi:hypothetical protein
MVANALKKSTLVLVGTLILTGCTQSGDDATAERVGQASWASVSNPGRLHST